MAAPSDAGKESCMVQTVQMAAQSQPRSSPLYRVVAIGSLTILGLLTLVSQAPACTRLQRSFGRPDFDTINVPFTSAAVAPVVRAKRQTWPANSTTTTSGPPSTATSTAPTTTATVLECFQVHQPVLSPSGPTLDSDPSSPAGPCAQVLMDHVFAYSYGLPFVANYTPPSCDFNRVIMNFTVVSQGRQFDRLAIMYLGDTEVWRTSTAEPTNPPGIRWVYLKDMTQYLYFWKSPQTLIFDLGNLVDSTYTGTFNTTLTATYFTEEVDTGAAPPSDLIIPISKKLGSVGGASDFIIPGESANATALLPRNVKRAVFSISANGQANEEFWWSNVLQSDIDAFDPTAGAFTGYSPFREVQLFIDGQLAGVQWAFPVIFTGGVVPSLHRPIVGLDAFDLREHEIDITPWLGLLCDGQSHLFEIMVAGLIDDGSTEATLSETVGNSWYVTGKIFLWLDDDQDSITTGVDTLPTISSTPPTIVVSQSLTTNGTVNETLTYTTRVNRTFLVSNTITSQSGAQVVSWNQSLTYSNAGFISAAGFNEINEFLISGTDTSSTGYRTEYKYPLYSNSTYSVSPQGNITLGAQLTQGLQLYVEGAAVFPTGLEAFSNEVSSNKYAASLLSTTKQGTASFFQYGDGSRSTGFGSSDQVFSFGGFDTIGSSVDSVPDQVLYSRHAAYVNGTITVDTEVVNGGYAAESGGQVSSFSPATQHNFTPAPAQGGTGPRVFMGRHAIQV